MGMAPDPGADVQHAPPCRARGEIGKWHASSPTRAAFLRRAGSRGSRGDRSNRLQLIRRCGGMASSRASGHPQERAIACRCGAYSATCPLNYADNAGKTHYPKPRRASTLVAACCRLLCACFLGRWCIAPDMAWSLRYVRANSDTKSRTDAMSSRRSTAPTIASRWARGTAPAA